MTNQAQNEPWDARETASDELGYQFSEPQHAAAPGGQSLTIHIHAEPTYHHFDPERVLVTILGDEGHPESLALHHPWSFGERYRAYPGRIHLIDRLGNEAHAFCFGGEWQVQSQAERTRLHLASTAPILDCNQPGTIACLLAVEVEILIAEEQALHSTLRDGASTARPGIDPWLVYSACLDALSQKYKHLGAPTSPSLLGFHQFLENEIERLQQTGQWPDSPPGLEKLLCY